MKLTSSIKNCMASVLPLSQCWGPTGSFSTWRALGAWAWMFSKKRARRSHPPSQNLPVEGLGSSGGGVSLHRGAGMRHRQIQNLFSLWVTPAPCWGMCTPEEEFTGGEKRFHLTIYRRSFRNMKYLSAKWGKRKEGLKSCRKNTWGLQLPGK